MFCNKCGVRLDESSAFCNKCGTKSIAVSESSAQPINAMQADKIMDTHQHSQSKTTNQDFRQFIDEQVKETTKFSSAEDLLRNAKPFTVLWICFGAVVLLFTVLAFPVGILLGAFFGYAVAYLLGRFMYLRVWKKFSRGKIEGELNLEDLMAFLSANLAYLSPYFKEWWDGGKDAFGAERIGLEFSEKVQAIIAFSEKQHGEMVYAISAEKGNMFLRVITRTDSGFGRLACLYKAAPIISAAMKYYLNQK